MCVGSWGRFRFSGRRRGPGGRPARQPPFLLQHTPEHELDLRVQAPQIVRRPALQGVEDRGIDPQQEGLALGHRSLHHWYSVPAFTIGCVSCSLHSTTSRLLTMAALRSSSRITTERLASSASAISTMLTAPSTIIERAAITALACWRPSIALAISGAYARRLMRDSRIPMPAFSRRAWISFF